MNFEREMMRHDLKAKSQIARSFNLQPVELPVKQSSLFAPTFEPDDLPEIECDHPITEPQASLFGGMDQVCVTCGDTVQR